MSNVLNLEIDGFMRGRKKVEIHQKTLVPSALNTSYRKHFLLAGHQFPKAEKASRKCLKKKNPSFWQKTDKNKAQKREGSARKYLKLC